MLALHYKPNSNPEYKITVMSTDLANDLMVPVHSHGRKALVVDHVIPLFDLTTEQIGDIFAILSLKKRKKRKKNFFMAFHTI